MDATQQVRRQAISAVVTRADGTVEDLGVVAYSDVDPAAVDRFAAARARGERVDEADLFVPNAPVATMRVAGQAVKRKG